MTRDDRTILFFLVLFGFFARAATYKSPLLDHHAWRQADTASIARNFYRERFDIRYPQIDARGAAAVGYVETGLEIFAFTIAAISKAAGFHHEIGRLLSAVLFVCSSFLVYRFVRERDGPRYALVAAFLYAFGFPLVLYIERTFMNEALLICLSLVCLVAAQRYLATRRWAALVLLTCACALVGAVKLPYAIVLFPVAGLFIERDGPRGLLRWELWLVSAATVAVAAFWYVHAHQLAAATGFTFGMSNKLFDARLVVSARFWSVVTGRLFKDVLGPVAFAGAAYGVRVAWRERRWCELLGIAGFAVYLLAVAQGNFVHDYYQLAIVPIAPSLAAVGLTRFADVRFGSAGADRSNRVLVYAMAVAVSATFVRSASAHSWYEYAASDVELCERLRAIQPREARVVFVGVNDPKFLYCADRKGWLQTEAEADEQHLRDARREGATIAAVPAEIQDAGIRRLLAESGTLVLDRPGWRVFELR